MKRLLVVIGWLAIALLTTATSTWAISLLGQGLNRHVVTPMTETQVKRALATASTAPAVPSRTVTAATSKAFATRGGSVVGGCAGDQALLLSWSPAQGYATGDIDKGPGPVATLEFESDTDGLKVGVTCEDGSPVVTVGPGGG
jgi:hypothetical protein